MVISRSKATFLSALFFISGIAIASFLNEDYLRKDSFWFFLIFINAIISYFLYLKNKIKISYLFLFLSFFIFGIWRYSLSIQTFNSNFIGYYNEKNVEISGKVISDPEISVGRQKFFFKPQELIYEQKKYLINQGNILIYQIDYPQYLYGEKLSVNCKLQKPEPIENFNYDRYLARYNIYSLCYSPKIKIAEEQNFSFWEKNYQKILTIKHKFHAIINSGLSDPESSIVNAIILGEQKEIDQDLKNSFARTGLSHIMAISGLNISLLIGLVVLIFLKIGLTRQKAFYATLGLLTFYLLLVGLPPSGIRSGTMGTLMLYAIVVGRINKIDRALLFSAFGMLLFNPRLLRDDIGFQLSFLSLASLIYFYPIFKQWSEPLLKNFNSWIEKIISFVLEIFNVTMAAQVLILPIMAFNFNQISIIAPVSNLLVLWVVPFLTVLPLIAIILSLIFPAFTFTFFTPIFFLSKYLIEVAVILEKVPYAYFNLDYVSIYWIILYLIFWGWIYRKNSTSVVK